MNPDPPVRRDGKCVVCLGPRKLPDKKAILKNVRELVAADPFCSSVCARFYYGCELPTPSNAPKEAA